MICDPVSQKKKKKKKSASPPARRDRSPRRETGEDGEPEEPNNRACLPAKLSMRCLFFPVGRGTFPLSQQPATTRSLKHDPCLSTHLNRSFLTSLWHSPKREKTIGGYGVGIRSKPHAQKK